MVEKLLIGMDKYDLNYMKYLSFIMGNLVKMQVGNRHKNVVVEGLENIINLNSDEKHDINSVITFVTIHFSLQDTNVPNLILYENSFKEHLPRTFGGNNLQFPLLTKNLYFIPAIIDMEKGGMISVERMGSFNHRKMISQFEERLKQFYENGINTRIYLTNGRPRKNMFEGIEAPFVRLIPSIAKGLDKQVYVVPEILSYERVIGDWIFSRQDLMKDKNKLIDWMEQKNPSKYFSPLVSMLLDVKWIEKSIKNSAVSWDAFALLYNSFFEPSSQIHIDYLEPIKINGNEIGKDFYSDIKNKINSNVRVSSTNIVSHIIKNHYENNSDLLTYNLMLKEIEKYMVFFDKEKIPLFDNIKDKNPEEIYERGISILSDGRVIPPVFSIGDKIIKNPKSKIVLDYYASRLI